MKMTATHTTIYRYETPVYLEPHIFRLQPRMTSSQRLLTFQLQFAPVPSGTTECLDQDGNLALNAWFAGATCELSVTSQFTVEMLRENPFDYVITGESLTLPLWYREPLSAALAPYRQIANVAAPVQQFARAIASETQCNALTFLTALTQRIFRSFRPVFRLDGPPWTPDRTLSLGEGPAAISRFCFATLAASWGSPRGSSAGMSVRPPQDSYMHAWAEVYLPCIGWRGYDPARGVAVSNRHVAVAAGFDPELASPVAGWYSGSSNSRMGTSLELLLEGDG